MSMTAVPISIVFVRAPTATRSGNGEPSWRAVIHAEVPRRRGPFARRPRPTRSTAAGRRTPCALRNTAPASSGRRTESQSSSQLFSDEIDPRMPIGTKSVIRVVDHYRCELPPGPCLLQQIHDAGPLRVPARQSCDVRRPPGDHGGALNRLRRRSVSSLLANPSPAGHPSRVETQRQQPRASASARHPLS